MLEYALLLAQTAGALSAEWLQRAQALWPRSLDEVWPLMTSGPGLAVGGGAAALLLVARLRGRGGAPRRWRPEGELLRMKRFGRHDDFR